MSVTNREERQALEDILFLALQRPTMLLGVPAEGCMLNVAGSIVASGWLGMGSWHIFAWLFTLAPSIHMLMRFGMERDYNYFRLKLIALDTRGRSMNALWWGGSTIAPLPVDWPVRAWMPAWWHKVRWLPSKWRRRARNFTVNLEWDGDI